MFERLSLSTTLLFSNSSHPIMPLNLKRMLSNSI